MLFVLRKTVISIYTSRPQTSGWIHQWCRARCMRSACHRLPPLHGVRHSAVHGAAASSATLELQLQLELELELALMFTPAVTGTANSSMIP
jgi:hypothetical protein